MKIKLPRSIYDPENNTNVCSVCGPGGCRLTFRYVNSNQIRDEDFDVFLSYKRNDGSNGRNRIGSISGDCAPCPNDFDASGMRVGCGCSDLPTREFQFNIPDDISSCEPELTLEVVQTTSRSCGIGADFYVIGPHGYVDGQGVVSDIDQYHLCTEGDGKSPPAAPGARPCTDGPGGGGGGGDPNAPKCICNSGQPTYPSAAECNPECNVIGNSPGHYEPGGASCTCYRCIDKCDYYEWDAPEGWYKNLVPCGAGTSPEIEHTYKPWFGGCGCTITKCTPCSEWGLYPDNSLDGQCYGVYYRHANIGYIGYWHCNQEPTRPNCYNCYFEWEGDSISGIPCPQNYTEYS